MEYHIGVTGTRSGMTDYQRERVTEIFSTVASAASEQIILHHGDCVGVDVEVADIATRLGIRTVCHPPIKEELRAFHKSGTILEQKTHFARNRDIVDACDYLLVMPWQMEHQTRGGTWYTHDYAVKQNRPMEIIWPKLPNRL